MAPLWDLVPGLPGAALRAASRTGATCEHPGTEPAPGSEPLSSPLVSLDPRPEGKLERKCAHSLPGPEPKPGPNRRSLRTGQGAQTRASLPSSPFCLAGPETTCKPDRALPSSCKGKRERESLAPNQNRTLNSSFYLPLPFQGWKPVLLFAQPFLRFQRSKGKPIPVPIRFFRPLGRPLCPAASAITAAAAGAAGSVSRSPPPAPLKGPRGCLSVPPFPQPAPGLPPPPLKREGHYSARSPPPRQKGLSHLSSPLSGEFLSSSPPPTLLARVCLYAFPPTTPKLSASYKGWGGVDFLFCVCNSYFASMHCF